MWVINMKNIADIKVTDRILNLREYYLNNSPMSVNRDLLVRIGGYSDFFVKIPKGLQDEIISRTHNKF